jgi:hypothetical protein
MSGIQRYVVAFTFITDLPIFETLGAAARPRFNTNTSATSPQLQHEPHAGSSTNNTPDGHTDDNAQPNGQRQCPCNRLPAMCQRRTNNNPTVTSAPIPDPDADAIANATGSHESRQRHFGWRLHSRTRSIGCRGGRGKQLKMVYCTYEWKKKVRRFF